MSRIVKKLIKMKSFWFTLVELIVVITILAILGTIAFISITWFSASARDSSRVSDIVNLSKWLDISYQKIGYYPTPDNSFDVTYSWSIIWTQGIVWDRTMNILNAGWFKLSKKPVDPLKAQEYAYSKLAYWSAYQIKTDWEGNSVALASHGPWNLSHLSEGLEFPQAEAASGNPTIVYIKGNYNGFVAKTETGSTKYLLAIPSLFLSTSINSGAIVSFSPTTQTGFLLHGQSNSSTGLLFTGAIVFSSGALPSTDSERILFASWIANAYSGTIFANNSNILPFITALNTNSTWSLANLGGSIVAWSLGGSAGSTQSAAPTGPSQTNPSSLSLSHSPGTKSFTFSWVGGTSNGGSCKLQYYKNGSTWTDISATIYNCDSTLSNQSVTLPADGWNGSWSSISVRIVRTSDSVSIWTFPQNLTCVVITGSATSTPNIDEDCNGTWDNTTNNNTIWCPSWNICEAEVIHPYDSYYACYWTWWTPTYSCRTSVRPPGPRSYCNDNTNYDSIDHYQTATTSCSYVLTTYN